jgi:hypothetical protein
VVGGALHALIEDVDAETIIREEYALPVDEYLVGEAVRGGQDADAVE